jgi:hypothetical protein
MNAIEQFLSDLLLPFCKTISWTQVAIDVRHQNVVVANGGDRAVSLPAMLGIKMLCAGQWHEGCVWRLAVGGQHSGAGRPRFKTDNAEGQKTICFPLQLFFMKFSTSTWGSLLSRPWTCCKAQRRTRKMFRHSSLVYLHQKLKLNLNNDRRTHKRRPKAV